MNPAVRDHGLPQLLTSADVASICQLKPRTVVRLATEGRLPAPRIDGHRSKRWHQADIKKWLETGRIN